MADIVFNQALGRLAHYASLPAANDGLVLVLLEAAGLVSDATMRDYDTLDAILAGASNEQTDMGRKALASVTVTVDDANDRVAIDAADVTWTATSGNTVGAAIVCYDPDIGAGTDADLVPLTKHDCVMTPDGTDFTLTISDIARASSAA